MKILGKLAAPVAAALFLTACLEANPIVSDFNGASVKIQTSQFATEVSAKDATQAEADRICGQAGKRAEYASTRVLPNYMFESLYLCL